jgi:HK97 family phage prohead protease
VTTALDLRPAAAWKATDDGQVEGYLSVFNVVDHDGDVVEPGAFRDVIKAWHLSGESLPLLADHDRDVALGEVVELEEDGIGVKFRARFGKSPQAQDARRRALLGDVRGCSYSFIGERRPGFFRGKAVRILERVKQLSEVTLAILSRPTNPMAQVVAAKAAGAGWPMMPVGPGKPAAHTVMTVEAEILERAAAPARAELAHKARWVEMNGWPGPDLIAIVGIESAYRMGMRSWAAIQPMREAREAAEAKARAEARAEADWQRGWAEIQERARQPCGFCAHCRHDVPEVCDYIVR